jgi:hypothetical protein
VVEQRLGKRREPCDPRRRRVDERLRSAKAAVVEEVGQLAGVRGPLQVIETSRRLAEPCRLAVALGPGILRVEAVGDRAVGRCGHPGADVPGRHAEPRNVPETRMLVVKLLEPDLDVLGVLLPTEKRRAVERHACDVGDPQAVRIELAPRGAEAGSLGPFGDREPRGRGSVVRLGDADDAIDVPARKVGVVGDRRPRCD